MSLEQSIADLVAIGGQNLALPQAIADTATQKLAAMAATYQGHLASFNTTFYVNAVTGSDNNAGTVAAPFATIQKAVALTPRGGRCLVILASNITLTADVYLDGIYLTVKSSGGTKYAISFDRYIIDTTTPNYRAVRGFRLFGGSGLQLSGVTINYPVLDGAYTNYTAANSTLIGSIGSDNWFMINVTISNCDVNIPAAPFCALILSADQLRLCWYSNTLTGAITSINGRILADQTNTAGVATNTLSYILTNLTTI